LPDVEYLTLADFLLVAEAATGIPAERLSRLPNLGARREGEPPERVELVERREAVAIAVQARTGLLQDRLEVAEDGARQVWGLRHMQGAAGRPLSGCRPAHEDGASRGAAAAP